VRVIAGSLGGRRLRAPRGARTRPTADRVREAVFAMLEPVAGARVLDLYAGSGALGIEALSRGAASAVFVERDGRALAVLRANLTAFGLLPGGAEVRGGEALLALRSARERGETYDLIFIDPPYEKAPQLVQALSAGVPPLLAPGGRVVLESDRRAPLELGLPPLRQRSYGDTLITIHRQQ
jgi:16S rRNA (guanine966-N2)-methyltransferase